MRRPRQTLGLLLLVTAAWLAAGRTWAQQTELDPSPALGCLTPAEALRPAPEYPFAAYKTSLAGRVKVALVFKTATSRPNVEVLETEGGDDFVDAVKEAVAGYRVPCLEAGKPARLVFNFVFKPDDRKVYSSAPTDAADGERRRLMDCAVQAQGSRSPVYPTDAQHDGTQGRVYAKLRFVAPDKPPEVELLFRESAKALARSVRFWLGNKRMPCLQGEPIAFSMGFEFKLGDAQYGFKPISLIDLLRSAKDLDKQVLSIDTRTMGCPFNLKLTYLQPQARNWVGQVGNYDPARAPLIEWLSKVELALPSDSLDTVFADTADVTVPCINLQLTPKEKTQ